MKRAYLLIEVELEKDIADLTDKAAGRLYTLDGVHNTTARLLTDSESFTIAKAWVDSEKAQEGAKSSLRDAINNNNVGMWREA